MNDSSFVSYKAVTAGAARAAPLFKSDNFCSMESGSAEPYYLLLHDRQWPPHILWASDGTGFL